MHYCESKSRSCFRENDGSRSIAYLELAKKGLLEPCRLFHKDKFVSKEFLSTDSDLDI
jgi:hypothetical protein